MEFSEIMSVSKLGGLYTMHKKRTDGLIIKGLDDDKIFFASSRTHVFTPLENITIYTDEDPVSLLSIFQSMMSYKGSIPEAKAPNADLKDFFGKILKNYDAERVYVSDIQKIIKWYSSLSKHKLIPTDSSENKKEETPVVAEEAETPKPKAKKTAKKTTKKDEA